MGVFNIGPQKPLPDRAQKSAQIIEGRSGRKKARFLILLPEVMAITPNNLAADFQVTPRP